MDLSGTSVTAAGLAHQGGLTRLQTLAPGSTGVGDKALVLPRAARHIDHYEQALWATAPCQHNFVGDAISLAGASWVSPHNS